MFCITLSELFCITLSELLCIARGWIYGGKQRHNRRGRGTQLSEQNIVQKIILGKFKINIVNTYLSMYVCLCTKLSSLQLFRHIKSHANIQTTESACRHTSKASKEVSCFLVFI